MKSLKDLISNLASTSATKSGSVGIDIGSSSIKVVELQDREGVLTLTTYGELKLGPYHGNELGETVHLEPKEEQEALVDVIRESAVTVKDSVFAMPLSSSFVTNVSIEAEPDADLTPMVRVEARKVIPASLSEVTLDWAEVEAGPQNDAEGKNIRRDVLIAAIQNAALERFKVLMQFAGFKQPPTEIECFSTIRATFNSSDEHVAVIDVGAGSTKLYIAHQGMLMRMHRVRAGGSLATQHIAKSMGVNFAEAEEKKLTTARTASDHADLKRIHNETFERAFREFNQVIREYERKTDSKIDTVYLAGGASQFPGFDLFVQDMLRKEILHAHPFGKVAYPAFMDDIIHEIGPSFTVALGAALRDFE